MHINFEGFYARPAHAYNLLAFCRDGIRPAASGTRPVAGRTKEERDQGFLGAPCPRQGYTGIGCLNLDICIYENSHAYPVSLEPVIASAAR